MNIIWIIAFYESSQSFKPPSAWIWVSELENIIGFWLPSLSSFLSCSIFFLCHQIFKFQSFIIRSSTELARPLISKTLRYLIWMRLVYGLSISSFFWDKIILHFPCSHFVRAFYYSCKPFIRHFSSYSKRLRHIQFQLLCMTHSILI